MSLSLLPHRVLALNPPAATVTTLPWDAIRCEPRRCIDGEQECPDAAVPGGQAIAAVEARHEYPQVVVVRHVVERVQSVPAEAGNRVLDANV